MRRDVREALAGGDAGLEGALSGWPGLQAQQGTGLTSCAMQVMQLVDMGFAEPTALAALRDADGDVNAAAERLLMG